MDQDAQEIRETFDSDGLVAPTPPVRIAVTRQVADHIRNAGGQSQMLRTQAALLNEVAAAHERGIEAMVTLLTGEGGQWKLQEDSEGHFITKG